MRIGFGYDAHRFADDRALIIGGVDLRHPRGLAGHSDADVLSHAVGDAILGAAGLGDLGVMFPGSERWKDVSSLSLLEHIAGALREGGYEVVNIDSTVIAEAPRIGPHAPEMRANLARSLHVDGNTVSVKATTTDGMGFIGRGEGIAATAVALIKPLV